MRNCYTKFLFKSLSYLFLASFLSFQAIAGGPGKPKPLQHKVIPGQVYVKFKPEFAYLFNQGKGERTQQFSQLFPVLSLTKGMPLSQNLGKVAARRGLGKSGVDIRLYHQLYFNADMPIEEAIRLLIQSGMVELAEPVYAMEVDYTPNDPSVGSQYYLDIINAFEAWDIERDAGNVVIAILDSGVLLEHEDLADNLYTNEDDPVDGVDNDGNGFVDDYQGWDFVGDDYQNPQGDNNPNADKASIGHGTQVAGAASAVADNDTGIAGPGFNARIMPIKLSAENDDRGAGGVGLILGALQGVIYAAENGADVINASYGGYTYSQIGQDIYNYAALEWDVTIIASAGNGNTDDPHYPSGYDNVLSVSATDRNNQKAGFSEYGYTVDIAAPGVSIFTTSVNGSYTSPNGTSFSAPIVAGAAALARTVYPELSGVQITELLRVTADNSFEANLTSLTRNKMGLGILDVQAALTEQKPSIRLVDYVIQDESGGVAQAGDEAFMRADFINYLWSSSGNLTVELESLSNFVEVTQASVQLGIIGTEEVTSNAVSPFQFTIRDNVPENTEVVLKLNFSDGAYQDYQYVRVLLNPNYLNMNENLVATTIAANGCIGYQDTEQTQGIGFVYDDRNLLFEMGLIMGTSETVLASNVRSAPGVYDNDFESIEKIQEISPGTVAQKEIFGSFDDSDAGSNRPDVRVDYRAYAWKELVNDQFVVMEYTVENTGAEALTDFYLGLYADWDIDNDFNDMADWDPATQTGYIYSPDQEERKVGAIQVLNGQPNYYAIDNDEDVAGNPLGVYDGYSDEEKFQTISSGIGKAQAGGVDGRDVSHTVASGPYTIPAGEKVTIAFALHGGSTIEEVLASAGAADRLYNLTLQAPRPAIDTVTICYGSTAQLEASGGNSYRWYTEISGDDDPFNENALYTTGQLFADTVYYVSNADNDFESARTPAVVQIAADPTIATAGGTKLCSGGTLELFVEEADAYLWGTGEETQSITITEGGTYSVKVFDQELGCETSDEITVEEIPSPEASFSYTFSEDYLIDRQDVTFTANAPEGATVFWDFGNGDTSTELEATATYREVGTYPVKLTVTGQNGCGTIVEEALVLTAAEDREIEGLSLYPNPTRAKLKVKLPASAEPYQLSISDVLGKVHFSQSVQGNGSAVELSMPQQDGMYFVEIVQEKKRSVYKIIVAK